MNPYVRERISRKLDTLTDERLYQVLDYVEFLEAKYAEKPATVVNVFQRFAEGVEDKMRSGGIAVGTISDTMSFLNKTMGVLNGVAQSTMSVANDVVNAAKTAADQVGAPPPVPGTAASTAAGTVSGPVPGPPPPPPAAPSAPPTAA
jgi:prophage DNA circulation protein